MTLTDILLIVSLVFSAIAGSAAVFAVLRIGTLAETLQPPPRQSDGEGHTGRALKELSTQIDDLANQLQTNSRQLDGIDQQLNELLSSDMLHPAPAPAAPPPAAPPPPPPAPEPVAPPPSAPPVPPYAPMSDAVPAAGHEPQRDIPVDPAPQPKPQPEPQPEITAEPSPAAPPSASNIARELVTGYQAAIAERSKGPIREWLAQNNSITLDISEDGQLIPSDSGQIAAIVLDQRHAILLPTAGFVVDFATRFAGSQISMRQVMRGCFDAVVDNSGEMRLQVPAIASRDGDRWTLEKPGRLSGFTDAS